MLFGEIITSKGLKIVMTRGENRKQRAEQYWLKEDRVRKKKTDSFEFFMLSTYEEKNTWAILSLFSKADQFVQCV